MGLGDRFKNMAKQAQEAVAEHKDQIHDAVDAVGVAADQKTRGKYTTKIAKVGQKAGDAVDKFGAGGEGDPDQAAGRGAAGSGSAPEGAAGPESAAQGATGTEGATGAEGATGTDGATGTEGATGAGGATP